MIKYLGRVLPRSGIDPAAAAAPLEDLADRALRSEFESGICLEAPEPVEVPASLLRADGRSIYQRHGGVRYATRAQVAMEERMLMQARAGAAPLLTRAQAAHALGADPARLEDALAGRAQAARAHDARDQRTQGGLREDQAAVALAVLTEGNLVSVLNAPAGSGKTRVLAEAARLWAEAGLGPVIGITPSQSARNTLATAGVPVSYNAAQFLGHLPGRRGARGPVPIGPGTLLVIDEASMISGPDLAGLIGYARACGAKIVLAGDLAQLQAVQNGGGMALLVGALGYARLAEPVRFRHRWEQAVSLRLRDGDTTVLTEYDQHGRITGGDPEQMMDAAAKAYVALTTSGTDTLLMAADHALRRELNRRIRDDLIALGIVSGGPAVAIADGAQASVGDLILCTRNDHGVEAGEPGRTLANGALLGIEAVTASGLIVRRALDADPVTGQRRWTDRRFLFAAYENTELGYAVTDHAAQGRTVRTGGTLLHLRDTYPVETAWAPPYVGDELRQVRAVAWDARLAGLRAAADARVAQQRGNHQEASRKHALAASYQALQEAYRQRERVFAAVMADRADWEQATRQQRHLAAAAAAELRRRHPGQHYPPLRSAEPEPATPAQRDQLTLTT